MTRITVLLAEDHQIVREGFRSLLGHEPDIEVVGEAATGREAVQLTCTLHPAVVVMDIAMPLLNGLEATRQIRKSTPHTKVVILSAHADECYVDQAVAVGASGFLLKESSSDVLANAIREVHKGAAFFSPSMSKGRQDRCQNSVEHKGHFKQKAYLLSSREVEVLQLVAEGMTNRQIAVELGLSFKTVDKHRQHLMGKLDIHDASGLTRYAIAEGLVGL